MSVPEQAPWDGVPAIDGGRRRHPTFVALVGFYVGMLLMIAIPSIFVVTVDTLFPSSGSSDGADVGRVDLVRYAPFALVPFAVPLLLLLSRRTRRFGRYMLLGMVGTALVVGGVGGGVLYLLVRTG